MLNPCNLSSENNS